MKLDLTLKKSMPWILIIGGIIGLFCSFTLTADSIDLIKHPNTQLNCDVNPVISCGNVINSAESTVFAGLPNPVFGIAAFSVIITSGVVILAGAKLKRWYWLGLNTGAFAGILFVHWLFYHSVYEINSLCPYCMVTWAVVIPTFWYTTLYNIDEKHLKLPKRCLPVAAFARRHHLDIVLLWLFIIAGLILKHFWYYYGRYF